MPNRISGMLLALCMGWLGGCSTAPPSAILLREFKQHVAQNIYDNFGYSEAEVYLTALAELSDEAVSQYGDRVCESIRRGKPFQAIQDDLRQRASSDDREMPYLQIAIVAERQRCPVNGLPQVQWQRSLLFLQEWLNGGQPLG
jgi:hypothetical protein